MGKRNQGGNNKKLQLKSETLRKLSAGEMSAVAGGLFTSMGSCLRCSSDASGGQFVQCERMITTEV